MYLIYKCACALLEFAVDLWVLQHPVSNKQLYLGGCELNINWQVAVGSVGMTVSLSSSLETWQLLSSSHRCSRADVDVGKELPLICVDKSLLVCVNAKQTLGLVSNFKPIAWNAARLGVPGWPVPTSYRSELQILFVDLKLAFPNKSCCRPMVANVASELLTSALSMSTFSSSLCH